MNTVQSQAQIHVKSGLTGLQKALVAFIMLLVLGGSCLTTGIVIGNTQYQSGYQQGIHDEYQPAYQKGYSNGNQTGLTQGYTNGEQAQQATDANDVSNWYNQNCFSYPFLLLNTSQYVACHIYQP